MKGFILCLGDKVRVLFYGPWEHYLLGPYTGEFEIVCVGVFQK